MLQILLFILAIVDILSGALIFFHPASFSKIFLYLGFICLTKGGWSLITALTSKFYFDFLGLLDIVSGIFLILLYYKFTLPLLTIIGIMIILKGIWSMFFSITS